MAMSNDRDLLRPMTNEEWQAELARDPSFPERRRAAIEADGERSLELSAPLRDELRSLGIEVEDEITNVLRADLSLYKAAVPILAKWLPQIDHPRTKESIVRSISTPYARSVAPVLIDEFRRAKGHMRIAQHWAIGNALETMAHDSLYDQFVELAVDKQYGEARQMIVLGLARMKNPAAIDVLVDLLDDPDVVGYAVKALRKRADPRTRSALERFMNHPSKWIRVDATKAIEKIDKKLSKE
jgi:hypothetical protein